MSSDLNNKSSFGEFLILIGVLAYSVYYLFTVKDMVWEARIYSFLLAWVVFFLSAVIMIQSRRKWVSQNKRDMKKTRVRIGKNSVLSILLILTTFVYIFSLINVGFILSSIGFIFLTIVIQIIAKKSGFGPYNLLKAVVYSISFCAIAFFTFAYLFQMDLPRGYLENLILGLIR